MTGNQNVQTLFAVECNQLCESMHDLRVIWVQLGKRGHAMIQHRSARYVDRHVEQNDSCDGQLLCSTLH